MIDKSLSQYQQNLLEGTTLGALRKAGIVDAPIQNYPTPKIAMQTPKVPNISLPESKAIMPAAKIKATPPITNLLGQNQEGAGLGSFDSKRYSALAKNFYDQVTAKKDNYLDQAVSDFLNRPVAAAADRDEGGGGGGGGGQEYSNYMTSSLAPLATIGGDFAQNLSGTTPLAPLALSLPSEGEESESAPSYSNKEMEDILKSADPDTENFITKTFDLIKNNPTVKAGSEIGKNYLIDTALKNTLAKQLGIGSMFGPVGMLFSWIFDTVKSKITGKPKTGLAHNLFDKLTGGSEDETTEDKIKKQEEIWERDDVDPADRGFTVSGTYGGNEVYSSDGSSVDSETGDITNADGSHGGNIVDEFVSTPTPAPTPAPTPPPRDSNGGGRDHGHTETRSSSGWESSPFNKGGRVDKALTGRSRDI